MLKTNINLSPSYSLHKLLYYKQQYVNKMKIFRKYFLMRFLAVFTAACEKQRYHIKPVNIVVDSLSLICPLTARAIWAPQMIRNQFPPFSPVLHCPLGNGELQACPFPDVVFPPLPLSASSSSPFHCALRDGSARPDERET